MKKTWRGRVLAMLLVLALTVGLVPAALAADSSTPVTFKQVSNDTFGTPVRPDLAVGEVSPLTPSAPTTSGEENCPSRSFRDLDTTKWYHEAIDTMLNEGLMNGTGNGLFEPNATLTRAMLVTILWRSEGKPTAADPTPFTGCSGGRILRRGRPLGGCQWHRQGRQQHGVWPLQKHHATGACYHSVAIGSKEGPEHVQCRTGRSGVCRSQPNRCMGSRSHELGLHERYPERQGCKSC